MSTVPPASSSPSALMSVLHESRRRDAARIIYRYRHLVAGGAGGELSAPRAAREASARPAANDGEIRMFRKLSANFLMALVLLGFGIAHVCTVVMMQRAAIPHERHAAIIAQGD
jgi:hypothetical protein